ncbi:MAG: LacI family DNA-binding transcriptional regulator [Opitutaceae bacterium]|nr:LacI family DNA-binding transcriptional regulator [Opitutaceae bacterium]
MATTVDHRRGGDDGEGQRAVVPRLRVRTNVTMRQVAMAAGVSRTTVSHALRGSPSVTPETRARVEAVARRLGYVLDPAMSRFMTDLRTLRAVRYKEALAAIVSFDEDQAAVDRFLRGARAYAEQFGYGIDVLDLSLKRLSPWRVVDVIAWRGIRGAIVVPAREVFNAAELQAIPSMSVVCMRQGAAGPRSVRIDLESDKRGSSMPRSLDDAWALGKEAVHQLLVLLDERREPPPRIRRTVIVSCDPERESAVG